MHSYILPVRETFLFNILHKLQATDCFSQLQNLLCFYCEIYFVIASNMVSVKSKKAC